MLKNWRFNIRFTLDETLDEPLDTLFIKEFQDFFAREEER